MTAARTGTATVQMMPVDTAPSAGAGTTTDPPGPVPENTSVAIIAPSAHASAAHRSAVSRRTASSSAPTPITATSRPSGIGPHIAACPIVPATP